jgi:hypothetical protein
LFMVSFDVQEFLVWWVFNFASCLSIWYYIENIIAKANAKELFPWALCLGVVWFQGLYLGLLSIFGWLCKIKRQIHSFECEYSFFFNIIYWIH